MIQKICLCLFLGYFTYEDIQKMQLSKRGILFFGILGIAVSIIFPVHKIYQILLGMGIGGFLLLASWISRQGIGAGDGIVVLICGIYLGFQKNCLLLICALLLSSLFSIILWIGKKVNRKQKIPFIPFLLLSYIGNLLLT